MRTICHYEIHRSEQSGDVDLCSACPQSHFSPCPSTETTLIQTGACRAFAFHWKLTNCKAARLCTFEIRQGYFRDHTLADFSLVLPLKKLSHGGNCVVSVSARVAPVWTFISLSVPSLFVPRQNNADQVAFQMGGGLSALEQILQVVTVASTPSAVPRIPLKWVPSPNCALLICILLEYIRFLFQARTVGNN